MLLLLLGAMLWGEMMAVLSVLLLGVVRHFWGLRCPVALGEVKVLCEEEMLE